MKKIICCLIVALLLLTAAIPFAASAANGGEVKITASTASTCPGKEVNVKVKLYNTNTGIMTLQADVCYDASFMTVKELTNGSVGRMEITTHDNSGVVKILATLPYSGSGDAYNETADGTLVTITFILNENATGSSDVTVENPQSFAYPESGVLGGVPVSVDTQKGSVAVQHKFTNYVSDGNASCTADGTKTAECDICGNAKDTVADVGSKKDHIFTNYVSNNDATCKADGTKTAKCDLCGEAEDTITDVGSSSLVPHTDIDQNGICDVCDKNLGSSCAHPSKTTHYSIDKEPTCNEPGFGTTWVRCAVCGCTLSKESYLIPATNKHVDENKDGKCDKCGTAIGDHVHELVHTDAKAATCTENGNVEYWYCEGCDSYFTDAEGKNKVDAADVVVPAAHKVEHVAAKEATETENGNVEYWHCPECGGVWLDADCTVAAKLEDVIIPATGHVHDLVYTPAKEATCFEEGNLEYWYCAGCDCYFTDAEGKYNIAYLSLILPVAHDIVHVEAKEATCFEEGNLEHWYCTKCGYAWLDEFCTQNTNLKAVILPVAHDIVHVEAKAPTCFEEGNIEYWYCTKCQYAWLDELCIRNTNLLAVILPVSHKIVHVEAKAPTATENGNIEYWYCTECGYAWLDELCTKNTNLKAVILPATGEDINPPTGDATILYIAAVVVVATLGVAVISFKKREEN